MKLAIITLREDKKNENASTSIQQLGNELFTAKEMKAKLKEIIKEDI